MSILDPAALDSATLVRRLHDLASDERRVQVDFLLHLDEFDRRQAFVPFGFGSLWDYCLKVLHLREGAAGRRIGAMRVLRRFPRLEGPLRDGRLCLSTASLLGQVLTGENLDELIERPAYRTKAEVEELVVSIRPKTAPREGIRKIGDSPPASAATTLPLVAFSPPAQAIIESPEGGLRNDVIQSNRDAVAPTIARVDVRPETTQARAEVDAVASDRWSLRVTLDAALKDDIETLRTLLSHKLPDGNLRDVLREAVRCGIDKHGKRRGAVAPMRSGMSPESVRTRADWTRYVPASVRRQVWARDGGQCTFVGHHGRRCECRWQLQFDHVDSAALGGPPTVENLRLRCRRHNVFHAEQIFGRAHMARFGRASGNGRSVPTATRAGESTIAGDSG